MHGFVRGEGTNQFISRCQEVYESVRARATKPVVVAEILVVPIGTNTAPAAAGLYHASSPAEALAEIERRTNRRADGAQGFALVADSLARANPVRIALQCEKPPKAADLEKSYPNFSFRELDGNVLAVSLDKAVSPADYIASTATLQDGFEMLGNALRRPTGRMDGDYRQPNQMPIPNFVAIRSAAQILSQRAQCFLILGKPGEALADLTLVFQIRRMLETPPAGKPITLVSAMIDVAIGGLYVEVVHDGFRLNAWRAARRQGSETH